MSMRTAKPHVPADRRPLAISIAGWLWVVMGSWTLLVIPIVLLVIVPVAVGEPAALIGIGLGLTLVALLGGVFIHVGRSTLRGTARDTLGNAIGSLVFGLFALLAVPGYLLEGNVLQSGANLTAGGALIAAAVLALATRQPYLAWRRGDSSP